MSARRTIGLDLGGTQVRAALVEDARIVRRASVLTDVLGGPMAVMDQIGRLIREVSGASAGDIAGIGVASAGPLDTVSGIILDIPTMPGFAKFPLRDAIAEATGLPVVLENDAIAAAFGEWRHGAGRGLRNMAYLTVSTGIGGGIVADGRLVRGRRGMAGHVGHIRLGQEGPRCACGATACFEALASGTALGRRARDEASRDPQGFLGHAARVRTVDARDVIDGARAGDEACQALVADEARFLGQGITAILHCFSPDRVILGGGVSLAFDLLADGIHAVVRADALPSFRDVAVVVAELGDNAGLIGAATMALDSVNDGPSGPD
jgi:glucokinase